VAAASEPACGSEVALWSRERNVTLAQRIVEMVIGRLITDEQFRADFLGAPEKTLLDLCERGMDLSRIEVAALLNTDFAIWLRAAEGVDPRLQKIGLNNETAKGDSTHV
jgi:hypothetical protein